VSPGQPVHSLTQPGALLPCTTPHARAPSPKPTTLHLCAFDEKAPQHLILVKSPRFRLFQRCATGGLAVLTPPFNSSGVNNEVKLSSR